MPISRNLTKVSSWGKQIPHSLSTKPSVSVQILSEISVSSGFLRTFVRLYSRYSSRWVVFDPSQILSQWQDSYLDLLAICTELCFQEILKKFSFILPILKEKILLNLQHFFQCSLSNTQSERFYCPFILFSRIHLLPGAYWK